MNKQNSLGSGHLKLQTGQTDSQRTRYYSKVFGKEGVL